MKHETGSGPFRQADQHGEPGSDLQESRVDEIRPMEKYEKKLGADHPNTLTSMDKLSVTHISGLLERSQQAGGASGGDWQEKAGSRPCSHAEQHEQPGIRMKEHGRDAQSCVRLAEDCAHGFSNLNRAGLLHKLRPRKLQLHLSQATKSLPLQALPASPNISVAKEEMEFNRERSMRQILPAPMESLPLSKFGLVPIPDRDAITTEARTVLRTHDAPRTKVPARQNFLGAVW
jgi:hypothetical protein